MSAYPSEENTDPEPRHAPPGRGYGWLPPLILLLAGLMAAVGAYALHVSEARLVAGAGKSLELLAADIADKLDQTLFERYGDIQVLADTLRPIFGDRHAWAGLWPVSTTSTTGMTDWP